VPIDFTSKEGRNLMLREIERILKNCKLRDEQVKRLISLRYRMYNNQLQVYIQPVIKIIRMWSTVKEYLHKLRLFIEDEASKIAPWRAKDDEKLLTLYKKYPDNWAKISHELIHRDAESCRKRYYAIQEGLKKGEWSAQETNNLIFLYNKYGNNFALISKKLPSRDRKQIRDRIKYLEKTKMLKFTPRMEAKLVSEAIKHKGDWEAVAKDSFPDFMPSILMTKYNEIMNRDDKDISCNRDQAFLIEGEESARKGEYDTDNPNKVTFHF
jgi:hypothetical protein